MNKKMILLTLSFMACTMEMAAKGQHTMNGQKKSPAGAKKSKAVAVDPQTKAEFMTAKKANNPAGLVDPINTAPQLANQLTPAMAAAVLAQPGLNAQATAALTAVAGTAAPTSGGIQLSTTPAAAMAGTSFTAPAATPAVAPSMIGAPAQIATPVVATSLIAAPTAPAQIALPVEIAEAD